MYPCTRQYSTTSLILCLVTVMEIQWGQASTCHFAVRSCEHPTQCPSWHSIWCCWDSVGLVAATWQWPASLNSKQDPVEWQVSTRVCNSYQAVVLPGPCRVSSGSIPEGGHTCICQWSEILRTEAAPPHGWRQVIQQGPKPVARGDRSPYGSIVATSQGQQEWITSILTVSGGLSPQKRMLAETQQEGVCNDCWRRGCTTGVNAERDIETLIYDGWLWNKPCCVIINRLDIIAQEPKMKPGQPYALWMVS
jgi:hypothetical protein